jgi:hypothetical protein
MLGLCVVQSPQDGGILKITSLGWRISYTGPHILGIAPPGFSHCKAGGHHSGPKTSVQNIYKL